jgi:hypothetical protein
MITLVTGTNQKNMGSNPRFGTHPTITKALRFFTFYVFAVSTLNLCYLQVLL